jgi:uncharacterized protein (DUF488 family)
MRHRMYTIGHSAMDISVFLKLLGDSGVTLVADVRSRPHSQRFPHFDQIPLQQALREAGVAYRFMGEELGGRPEDPKAYGADGVVDYRRRREANDFQAAIERLVGDLGAQDVALMCAEEDPLSCHRFLMICPELVAQGVEPGHIRKGGVLESQREAEDRLLRMHGMNAIAGASLFASEREVALEEAYVRQSKEFAFRLDPAVAERWQE